MTYDCWSFFTFVRNEVWNLLKLEIQSNSCLREAPTITRSQKKNKKHPLVLHCAFCVFLLRHSTTLTYTRLESTLNKSPFFNPNSLNPFFGCISVKYGWWWRWWWWRMSHNCKLHLTHRVFRETTFCQRALCLNTLWVQPEAARLVEFAEWNTWPHVCNYLLYLGAIFDELQMWCTHHKKLTRAKLVWDKRFFREIPLDSWAKLSMQHAERTERIERKSHRRLFH